MAKSGMFSSDSLNDSVLTCPRAPSLDPRLGITNREHHQLVVEQIVPVVVSHRKMPAAEHGVNVGFEVDGKLSLPHALILPHNGCVFETIVVAVGAFPTV